MSNAKSSFIGLYDTGLGGFTIYRHLRHKLPHEEFVAIADSELFRYGKRSFSVISKRTESAIHWLTSRGARAVVIACNTAFLSIEDKLTTGKFDIPVVGPVYPAIEEALRQTSNLKVGVVATDLTAQSGRYGEGFRFSHPQVEVAELGCSSWVFHIERGDVSSPELLSDIKGKVDQLVEKNVDTVVLGCTHFPIIRDQVAAAFPYQVRLVDSASGIEHWLLSEGLCSTVRPDKEAISQNSYLVTDEPQAFRTSVGRIFDVSVEVEHLELHGLEREG